MTPGTRRYEVVIAGAGPAGCAVALALQRQGVVPLLLDRPLAQPFRIGESATPDVAALLAPLGLTHALDGQLPYHGNISLWGSTAPRRAPFLFHAQGNGWHLDRAAFDRTLRQEALARGVELLEPSGVDAIAPTPGGWRLEVRGRGSIEARVVVDAGGRRSPLATRLGRQRCQLDRLQALACHGVPGTALAGYSLVESCPFGWWYAAGLPDGRAVVALMTDQDIARAHQLHDPEPFLRAWRATRLLADYVPPPGRAAAVHAFAAHSGCIRHAAGPNWICVGDALMGLDPLTSSGLSGALSDAQAAVPAIIGMLQGRMASDYARRANDSFTRYLSQRRHYYALETRWATQAFWQRRTAASLVSG